MAEDQDKLKQAQAALQVIKAVADAIHSLGVVPAGVLYAHLMGVMTLEDFQFTIRVLKATRLVAEKNHLLYWTEPDVGLEVGGILNVEDLPQDVIDQLVPVGKVRN